MGRGREVRNPQWRKLGGSMSERLAVRLGVSLVALFCLSASLSLAAAPLAEPEPGAWQQVARFGGTAVRGAQAFTIGDAAYVVSGMTDNSIPHHEVWRYGAGDNVWTRMGDFPGTPVIEGVGFSIGNVGLRLPRSRERHSRQGLRVLAVRPSRRYLDAARPTSRAARARAASRSRSGERRTCSAATPITS